MAIALMFAVAVECTSKGPDKALGFYALSSRTGATLWRSSTIGELAAAPGGLAGLVRPAVVEGLDRGTPPRVRWRYVVPPEASGGADSRIVQPLTADEHNVYFVGGNKRVYALDDATGTLKWRSDPLVEEYAKLGAGAGGVYFVDDDRNLHALDAATGAPRWIAHETACTPKPSINGLPPEPCAIPAAIAPIVVDGSVFFPDDANSKIDLGFDPATGTRTTTMPVPPDASFRERTIAEGAASIELGVLVGRDQVGHEIWHRDFGVHQLSFELPDDPEVVYLRVDPPPAPED